MEKLKGCRKIVEEVKGLLLVILNQIVNIYNIQENKKKKQIVQLYLKHYLLCNQDGGRSITAITKAGAKIIELEQQLNCFV
jgi:hypothetical protein